jgi:hypothetical protein
MATKTENGETPLHLVLQHRASKRSLEILRLFVELYPSAAGEATANGWIPLHPANSQLPYRSSQSTKKTPADIVAFAQCVYVVGLNNMS